MPPSNPNNEPSNMLNVGRKKSDVNKPRFVRSAAPSPSLQAPFGIANRPSPNNSEILSSNIHQRSRSTALPPSTRDPSEVPHNDCSFFSDLAALPTNNPTSHQRARSNAPSPSPSISTNLRFNSTGMFSIRELLPESSHSTRAEDLHHSGLRTVRERSNAPSPSPSLAAPHLKSETMISFRDQPKSKAESESEDELEITSSGRTNGRAREPAPRTFRSSAPSPDRSLSMSCTPPAGPIPPGNGQAHTSNVAPVSTTSSQTTRASSPGGSSCREPLGEESDDEDSEGEEEGGHSGHGERGEDGDAQGSGYDPENDTEFRDIYRRSVSSVTTSTVSISSPRVPPQSFVPSAAAQRTRPTHLTQQAHQSHRSHILNNNLNKNSIATAGPGNNRPTGFGSGNDNTTENEEENRRVWNPPHAPRAMQSHLITWINDKKVGERINGVQVPVDEDEDDEVRDRARKKGLSGKFRIEIGKGKKGGRKG